VWSPTQASELGLPPLLVSAGIAATAAWGRAQRRVPGASQDLQRSQLGILANSEEGLGPDL